MIWRFILLLREKNIKLIKLFFLYLLLYLLLLLFYIHLGQIKLIIFIHKLACLRSSNIIVLIIVLVIRVWYLNVWKIMIYLYESINRRSFLLWSLLWLQRVEIVIKYQTLLKKIWRCEQLTIIWIKLTSNVLNFIYFQKIRLFWMGTINLCLLNRWILSMIAVIGI
jgi:hypothetical protein